MLQRNAQKVFGSYILCVTLMTGVQISNLTLIANPSGDRGCQGYNQGTLILPACFLQKCPIKQFTVPRQFTAVIPNC